MNTFIRAVLVTLSLLGGPLAHAQPDDATKPTVPTGLILMASTSNSLSLTWSASTDNIGVTGYRIYRNGSETRSTSITAHEESGLASSTQYVFRVSAYDAAGNESAQSTPTLVTTQGTSLFTPGEPSGPARAMYAGHPRLFVPHGQSVAGFRQQFMSGYARAQYLDLKAYVDFCMGPAGWRSGWLSGNLASITLVAFVEQTPPYLAEAAKQAGLFIQSDPRYGQFGQLAGFHLSALAMYYDLLWDHNSGQRQSIAAWLRNAYLLEFSQFNNSDGGNFEAPIGNHYLDSIMRSEWFALTCKGDGYFDNEADKAYAVLQRRWGKDGDMKSAMRLVGGPNGGMYEGSLYFTETWLPVLSTFLAAYQTAHPDVTDEWIQYNYAMVFSGSKVLLHAKRPWDGILDQSGDQFVPWHIAGFFGASVTQKWGGAIGHALVPMMGNSVDPLAQWPAPDVQGDSYRNGARAFRTLFLQDVADPDWSTVEKSLNTTPEGGMVSYMRSAWNNSGATWASFEATDRIGGHRSAAQGHFQIGKHAILAMTSGSYNEFEGDHEYNFQKRTYANNCMTVYQPNQIFHIVGKDLASDGGQFWPGTFWWGTYAEWMTAPHDLSNDIRYGNGEAFTYSHADIANAYNDNPSPWGKYLTPDRLSSYTRQFIYFRPDYFVVIDRMVSTEASYRKKWILHTPGEPTVTGSALKADNGHGRLFSKTLFPQYVAINKFGGANMGDAYYSPYTNRSYLPLRWNESLQQHVVNEMFESRSWRTEVEPTIPATDDLFVHVMQATDVTTDAMIPSHLLAAIDSAHYGVHLAMNQNPRIVVFSKTNTRNNQTTFTVSQTGWSGTAGLMVTDLEPGLYAVSKDGHHLCDRRADINGMIYFEDSTFGQYALAYQSDTNAPSIPTNLTGTVASPTAATLTWTASTDTSGVAGYQLYRNGALIGTTTATNYTNTGLTTGTPYSYQVAAFDAAGNVSGRSASVTIVPHDETFTTFTAWVAGHFTAAEQANAAISGPNADPDGCGLPNLLRYACGLPARGRVANPTTPGTTTSAGASYLTLTFPRRAAADDLTYTLEASTDLVTWTAVPGRTYTAGSGPITAQDAVALGSTPRRFLRLRITKP